MNNVENNFKQTLWFKVAYWIFIVLHHTVKLSIELVIALIKIFIAIAIIKK